MNDNRHTGSRWLWFLFGKYSLTFLCICLPFYLSGQKVGLVMSGGGAKGMTHIGVIKALEENGIPIDYVAGTSMGAIVGSLYAIGMTPDEMVTLIKSDEFHRWLTGEIDTKYNYYFRKSEPRPSIFEMGARVEKGDSLVFRPYIFPTNVVNPRQMNFAVMELYSPACAACGGNFDKLMVPFRCVASDIYEKEAVVFRNGDLGDAVRSSMSFPFMFRPVESGGRLLYDGGIYNNFPADVMLSDFHPDYLIGSSVSVNSSKPDKRDIVALIEKMIVQPTNYSIEKGLLLNFKWDNINIWDFSIVDQLVQLGYDSTMAHMDELKAVISRRTLPDDLAAKRKEFVAKQPPLRFQEIEFTGINKMQQNYVEHVLHRKGEVFNIDEFRKSYFNLIADNAILEVIPHAEYEPETGLYKLHLNVLTRDQLKIAIGGNISSSTPNQTYIGFSYQNLGEFSQQAWADLQFGRTYNGLSLGTRLDVRKNIYLKPQIVMHRFDYFEDNRWFYSSDITASFKQTELYAKFMIGIPLTMKARMEFGAGYGWLFDKYLQDKHLALEYQEFDKSSYSLFSVFDRMEGNSLNGRMYPTAGCHWYSTISFLGGTESFRSTMFPKTSVQGLWSLWLQYDGHIENYFRFGKHFSLGASADLAFSTRSLLRNYTATIIQAPRFTPTVHSRAIFNEGFCANHYLAIGVKPIYVITDRWQARLEGYAFAPYKTIMRKADNSAYYSDPFQTIRFMAETSVVYNFKIASVSVYVNYYSTPKNNWNVGLNIGFLLFEDKFIE